MELSAPTGRVRARELGYLVALARAGAGALLFALPLFMTQEMWLLGAGLGRGRLVLFLVLAVPLLTGLTWYAGFEAETDWRDALLDAFVAYAVAFLVAGAALLAIGVLDLWRMSLADLGTVAIQAVPTAFGAALAQSQLGGVDPETRAKRESCSYWAELFLMVAGALFVTFNIAPTEEVLILAHGLGGWQFLALMAISLGLMHAFVYGVGFSGQEERAEHRGPVAELIQLTVVGYALVLLVCLYVLWILGRTDGQAPMAVLQLAVVLAFPGGLGAAAARLIL